MSTYAIKVTAPLTAAFPAPVLLTLGGGAAVLFILVYAGIALPAVWSAKPARRKAAAAVLRQILEACTHTKRH